MDTHSIGWNVLQILSPVLLAGLSWLSVKATQLISAKVKNEYLKGVLVRLDAAVLAAVREVQQVVVENLKAARADGQLTPDERAQVKQAAIDSIKAHLGSKGMAEVAHILGLEDGTVDKLLSTRVEAAVHDLRAAQRRPVGVALSALDVQRAPASPALRPARAGAAGTSAEASGSSPKARSRRR